MPEVNFLVKKGLTVPKGSAATPSVIFDASDSDTGIYSPGANQLALSTNGTGRLFIDASGNVGIGASSSITGLELSGNIQIKYAGVNSEPDGTRYLIFNNTDTTLVNDQPLGGISWGNNDADATAGQAAFVKAYTQNNTGAAYLSFGTGSQNAATERLRITSAGLVGIGISAPAYNLHVSDTASIGRAKESGISGSTGEPTIISANSLYSNFSQFNLTGGSLTLAAGAVNTNRVGNGEGRTYTGGDVSIFAGNAQYAGTTGNTINRGNIIFGRRSVSLAGAFTDSELARIDSSGRLLVGTPSSSNEPRLVVVGNQGNNNGSGWLALGRGESASTITGNEGIGVISFTDNAQNEFAQIAADADAAAGAGDYPGRLKFSTTPDSGSSPVERLRITNDGVLVYNQPAPAAVNATATLTVANLKTGIITSTSAAATDMTLPTGTDTEAGFSGVYTNFTFEWSVINTGPSLVRVLAGTAHTIVGSGSVATGTSGRFASRRTAANTFVSYRLS